MFAASTKAARSGLTSFNTTCFYNSTDDCRWCGKTVAINKNNIFIVFGWITLNR